MPTSDHNGILLISAYLIFWLTMMNDFGKLFTLKKYFCFCELVGWKCSFCDGKRKIRQRGGYLFEKQGKRKVSKDLMEKYVRFYIMCAFSK